MSWFCPEEQRAAEIARDLCARSLGWARTIRVALGRSTADLEEELWDEILAYTLCVVNLRLAPAPAAEREGFVSLLRRECTAVQVGRGWRRRRNPRALPPPSAPGSDLESQLQQYRSAGGDPRRRLTPERFEEFCRLTGLSSRTLVGNGENLASLMFYIAVYTVAGQEELSREEGGRLLRAMRECRTHLERAVTQYLSEPKRLASA